MNINHNKNNMINLKISNLIHTWFIDLDGTIFKHNAYKENQFDVVVNSNVQKFFDQIPKEDFLIFTTSRSSSLSRLCEESLSQKVKIKQKFFIIYDLPHGERILLNDSKPSGLITSLAINFERDQFPEFSINTDANL
tara:strand:+ start:67 stop:477 length:411 start_codon:yes stop_codon:yes gene_type:complete